MGKKVIQLTEGTLAEMIKNITLDVLNEMDGATYSRIYNASHRAKTDNQNGSFQRSVGSKTTNNDDIISRARKIEPSVQQHWLNEFIGKTFKFYGEDRMGLIADVLFTFDRVKKLDKEKSILVGTVIFNDTQINGDGIVVNFAKEKVLYHERGNRYAYVLEIDNRSKSLWDKLLSQLKMAIDARK